MNHLCLDCGKEFESLDQDRLLCGQCECDAVAVIQLRRAMIERDHTAIFNATQKPETNPAAN